MTQLSPVESESPKIFRRKRRKFELKKTLFILPNAFTLASVFCGVYAILNCMKSPDPEVLYQSAMALVFAGFFDLFDGRVARLTRTQSDFGVQLDSLADMISFGIAPAIVVFKWALWPLGAWGIFGAFFYTACGAIRLARFNVLAARSHGGSGAFFVGLPIPLAASVLIMLIVAHFKFFGDMPVERNQLIFSLVLGLGVLMVSNVPYWTFKGVHFTGKIALFLFSMAGVAWLIGLYYPMSLFMLGLLCFYILAGLLRGSYLLLARKRNESLI